jgi:hypothetical protein
MADSEQDLPSEPRSPWKFHPALIEERLRICGRLLAHARRDAVAMAAYELGDDSWSVGCRAHAQGQPLIRLTLECDTTIGWHLMGSGLPNAM